MPCTRHRVFLAALIVAAKYLNDSSPRNSHWAAYGVIFNNEEVNLMEKQLLFFLDYDLRFNEYEACMVFAPFMTSLTPAQQHEARAAAVARVTKAGKARAQAQMPPTPPAECDTVPPPPAKPPTIASTVCGIVKRLSSTHLSTSSSSGSLSHMASPMYSTISASSSSISTSGSEMGSLIDDTGSSSSGMSSSEDEADESEPEERKGLRKYAMRPVSTYAYKRGRKPSDTSSVISTATVKGSGSFAQPRSTSKRSSSYYMHGRTDDIESLSASGAMSSISRGSNGTTGFLSRMWGAAKGQPLDRESHNKISLAPPDVSIVEPAEVHPHGHGGSSTFRRIVHSSSTVFRNGSQILDV